MNSNTYYYCWYIYAANKQTLHLQVAQTLIPRDFILDKRNYTEDELEARFSIAGLQLFNKNLPTQDDIEKRQPAALPLLPEGKKPREIFASCCNSFRDMVLHFAKPRLNELFKTRYHDLVADREHINGIDEFEHWYRTGPYGNSMRGEVNTVLGELWGKQCTLIPIEQAIMALMNVRYTDYLVDGSKMKNDWKSGCVRILTNRQKQTIFLDRLRKTGRDVHKEVIYQRDLKVRPMKAVAQLVKTIRNEWGYDGYCGLCFGHKLLAVIGMQAVKDQPSDKLPCQISLKDFLKKKIEEGSEKSPLDLIEEWEENGKEEANKVTMIKAAKQSDISPLTTSPSTLSKDSTEVRL